MEVRHPDLTVLPSVDQNTPIVVELSTDYWLETGVGEVSLQFAVGRLHQEDLDAGAEEEGVVGWAALQHSHGLTGQQVLADLRHGDVVRDVTEPRLAALRPVEEILLAASHPAHAAHWGAGYEGGQGEGGGAGCPDLDNTGGVHRDHPSPHTGHGQQANRGPVFSVVLLTQQEVFRDLRAEPLPTVGAGDAHNALVRAGARRGHLPRSLCWLSGL